jgi:hypothetical protein
MPEWQICFREQSVMAGVHAVNRASKGRSKGSASRCDELVISRDRLSQDAHLADGQAANDIFSPTP